MAVVEARKPGHISCGNGVITSPITVAITAGGLQKPGNKAYRNTDGHSCEDMHQCSCTEETISNTHVHRHAAVVKTHCLSILLCYAEIRLHHSYVFQYVCV